MSLKLLKFVTASLVFISGVTAHSQVAAPTAAAQNEVFHNASSNYQTHAVSVVQRFVFDTFDPRHVIAHNNLYEFNAPGFSWGNAGGWSVQQGDYESGTFNTRGIGQMSVSNSVKHAAGDFAAQYIYATTDGGATAKGDEGFTLDTREGGETDSWFHGTVAAGAMPGTTLLPVSYVAGPLSQDATTDGAYMLDISKGTISGFVTGPETLVEGTSVHVLPVSAKLPPSTGIGIVTTSIPKIKVANIPETLTLANVQLIHGSFTTGKACLAGGWYPEQVLVTKTGPTRNNMQDVTITYKNPNEVDANNPTSLWQGGVCGQYLSLDNNVARDGFLTSYEVVGATDSNHLAYIWNIKGGTKKNILAVYQPSVHLKDLSRIGGVVTASFVYANQTYIFNHAASIFIADADNPSFNGTFHLPAYDDDLNGKLSWSQPGQDGAAHTATINLPNSYYSFHLYPGAEVLGPMVAGQVPLEPNSVNWVSGDAIENPHNPSFYMGGRMTVLAQHTLPSDSNSYGQIWGFRGAGISANYYPSSWINGNPCSFYIGCGGTLIPIRWDSFAGPYGELMNIRTAPLNNGTILNIGCDSRGCDHMPPYRLFQLQNGTMKYDPSNGTFTVPRMSANLFSGPITTTQIELQDPKSPDKLLIISNSRGQIVIRGSETVSGNAVLSPVNKVIPNSDSSKVSAAAAIMAGPAMTGGGVTCARGYTCTSHRGRVTFTASTTSATGLIASVKTMLSEGEICTATQNGGANFFGIGSGKENPKGFVITADVALHGSVTVDYSCR